MISRYLKCDINRLIFVYSAQVDIMNENINQHDRVQVYVRGLSNGCEKKIIASF